MRMKTMMTAGACMGLLAGCGTVLDEARTMKPAGSDYARELHKGYIEMAQQELDESDLKDARLFALRARSAGLGNPEPVEPLDARQIPASHRDALSNARERLVKVMDASVSDSAPKSAATARLMYDCWTQEQEENIQPAEIAACRTAFESAMAELETRTAPSKVSMFEPGAQPEAQPAAGSVPVLAPVFSPTPVAAPVSDSGGEAPVIGAEIIKAAAEKTAPVETRTKFVVPFDFDTADIKDAARGVLNRAIDAARGLGASVIKVTGHTDRAGPLAYNETLSKRRAEAVATALGEIDPEKRRIDAAGLGEATPAIKTQDGVREPANRRVEIELIN